MIVKRKLYSVIDEEGNLGYYLYNESTGEEKLFSVVEDERLYFLGEHKGKFGKGGTASGVVFTGKDMLNTGAENRLRYGPKDTRGRISEYINTEAVKKSENAFNNTYHDLTRKGVDRSLAGDLASEAGRTVHRRPSQIKNAIRKQKFNRSALGKVLKKVKIR